MPEFVTCPACGCRTQLADAMLGQRLCCFGCNNRFVAVADSQEAIANLDEPAQKRSRVRWEDYEEQDDADWPYCPGCGRQVPWEVPACPRCGEEFEDDSDRAVQIREPQNLRRDSEPHHGPLLSILSLVSVISLLLAIASVGILAVVSLPLGVVTWAMAQSDLRQMDRGIMDDDGRPVALTARRRAMLTVIGTALAVVIFLVIYLGSW